MEIIAIGILILLGIGLEKQVYKKYILPYISYGCEMSKKEVYEGEQLELTEIVANPTWLMIPCLKSEITTSKYLGLGGEVCAVNEKTRSLGSLFSIKAHQKVTRNWRVKTLKRGCYKVEDITIVATDLLSCYKYSTIVKVKDELIVLPKPIDIETQLISPQYNQGEQIVKRFILEDPFYTAGVRKYTSRDSMNKIHWGMTARSQEIMVRNNETTAQQSLTIILNMQTDLIQMSEVIEREKIEVGIKLIAGLLDTALEAGVPVKFMSNTLLEGEKESIETKEMWGRGHTHELYTILAKLELKQSMSFSQYLKQYVHQITSTDVVIVTCFLDEVSLNLIKEKLYEGYHIKVCLLSYEQDKVLEEIVPVYYLRDELKSYLPEAGEINA